jgi:hypothetical protein
MTDLAQLLEELDERKPTLVALVAAWSASGGGEG